MADKIIYLVNDPDGDRFAFDTENAAKKFVIKQVKKYNILDDEYLDYIKHLMAEEPKTTPSSYYAFIDKLLQSIDDMENFDYCIEDLDVMTEDDLS
jgi:hypothetical protein